MFSRKNIKDIPIEETPHSTGSRKLLVGKDETTSSYFEAYTYGYLPPNEKWAIHKHENIDEICLVKVLEQLKIQVEILRVLNQETDLFFRQIPNMRLKIPQMKLLNFTSQDLEINNQFSY